MKNRKSIIEEEPLWKKRRKEEQQKTRKSRLWIAVVVIILVAAVSLMIYGAMKSLNAPRPKTATEPHHTVAQIADKIIKQQNGKTEWFIVFRVEGKMMRKSVDQATFDSLEKGKQVLLTFDPDYVGRPKNIRGWSPLKLATPAK